MLLEEVGYVAVAGGRRVEVPRDGVASAPVSERLGADVHRHAYAVAGVELGSAHLRQFPSGAEVSGTHFRVRLESAAGERDGAALDVVESVGVADGEAGYLALPVGGEGRRLRAVGDGSALAFDKLELAV